MMLILASQGEAIEADRMAFDMETTKGPGQW